MRGGEGEQTVDRYEVCVCVCVHVHGACMDVYECVIMNVQRMVVCTG